MTVITAPTKYLGSFPFYSITLKDPSFSLFKELESTPFDAVLCTESIDHSNFISQGVHRAAYLEEVKQKAAPVLRREFELYQQVVLISKDLLDAQRNKTSGTDWQSSFQPLFKFEELSSGK